MTRRPKPSSPYVFARVARTVPLSSRFRPNGTPRKYFGRSQVEISTGGIPGTQQSGYTDVSQIGDRHATTEIAIALVLHAERDLRHPRVLTVDRIAEQPELGPEDIHVDISAIRVQRTRRSEYRLESTGQRTGSAGDNAAVNIQSVAGQG